MQHHALSAGAASLNLQSSNLFLLLLNPTAPQMQNTPGGFFIRGIILGPRYPLLINKNNDLVVDLFLLKSLYHNSFENCEK